MLNKYQARVYRNNAKNRALIFDSFYGDHGRKLRSRLRWQIDPNENLPETPGTVSNKKSAISSADKSDQASRLAKSATSRPALDTSLRKMGTQPSPCPSSGQNKIFYPAGYKSASVVFVSFYPEENGDYGC